MKQLEGRPVAEKLMQHIKKQIEGLSRPPALAFIIVGTHAPSHTYVRVKKKRSAEVGITSYVHELPETVAENQLIMLIEKLNQDPLIDGILVQQPLPKHLSTVRIMEMVDPRKDVDGFHPLNLGKLMAADPTGFIPCTPLGIQHLLLAYGVSIEGKHVVILGRSLVVGRPLACILSQKSPQANATVTLAHAATRHLSDITCTADILVAAVGKPLFVTKQMIKPGAVVVDVGINRLGHQIVGDVDAKNVEGRPSYLTPVPGGVGPMTIAMLLSNTLLAYKRLA